MHFTSTTSTSTALLVHDEVTEVHDVDCPLGYVLLTGRSCVSLWNRIILGVGAEIRLSSIKWTTSRAHSWSRFQSWECRGCILSNRRSSSRGWRLSSSRFCFCLLRLSRCWLLSRYSRRRWGSNSANRFGGWKGNTLLAYGYQKKRKSVICRGRGNAKKTGSHRHIVKLWVGEESS